MKKSQYRAVQIDLARQIETMETVLRYFDLAAEAGMNMVVLYLEDRIRTKTYPYPAEGEAYSEEQIREMVAYAEKRGLELVPVVSPIGHTERFLAHKELEPLAELHGNIAGRFFEAGKNASYHEACPMRPQTAAFMDAYLTEVAALFPSPFFHLGFDEIFNMGFCDTCRAVVKEQGLPVLFRDTLLHYYHLLKKLGKTVMIWDDMLEQCDSMIDDIPHDIILCAWFYQFYQRFPEARFTTSRRYDMFKKFERWGFRYFACSNIQIKSIDTLTEYARRYEPLGMLMTNWEMSTQPNAITELSVRYAGLLWNDGARPGFETLVRAAEQTASSPLVAQAVATAATYGIVNRYNVGVPSNVNALALNRYELMKANSTAALLASLMQGVTETDDDCVQCYYVSALHYQFAYLLRAVAYDLFQYRTGEIELDKEACRKQLATARRLYGEMDVLNRRLWENSRKGIASPQMEQFLSSCGKSLQALEELLETAKPGQIGRLDVHFCLPEYTSRVETRITLLYSDGTEQEVANGVYKADRDVYFDYAFAIPANKIPTAIRFDTNGHGSSGFCYADVTLPEKGRFIPEGILGTYGHVEHAEYMLIDDFTAVVCGDPEMLRTFLQPDLAWVTHGFTISLKEE